MADSPMIPRDMVPPPSSRRTNPNLDLRDCPEAISVAAFEAHLEAHRLLEEQLKAARKSDPITLRRGPLAISGRGAYVIGLALIALAAEIAWLVLR